jgi:AcrR family transcriptional regulator
MILPKTTFFNLPKEKQNRIFKAILEEFSNHSYNEVTLSNIIRKANIPRGSLYQYFNNKEDLYTYIFTVISKQKIKYLSKDIQNQNNLPFIELFRKLMEGGIRFAIENPQYIKFYKRFVSEKENDIYKKIMGDTNKISRSYYKTYIQNDKKQGRIRKEIDTDFLVDIIIDITTGFSLISFGKTEDLNYETLLHKTDQFLLILKKGIE